LPFVLKVDENMVKIKASEITPEHVYLSRRKFMAGVGALAATAVLGSCAGEEAAGQPAQVDADEPLKTGASADELGDPLTAYEAITNYNNYYEFSTDKREVAVLARGFNVTPWAVQVGGLVRQPKTYGVDDLLKKFAQEERVYRLRCVEGWSMVIPWLGFPLAGLLKEVEPLSQAKYVRFEALLDKKRMPGQLNGWYTWPYVEGLRLDEAMNDLAILATGLYGRSLPPQNGAPIRLVTPWKYGFKSIKGVVKIDLVEEQPTSLWMRAAPHEYGFYSNVNPDRPHPRWSQATERRIGEVNRRPTLMFNGYADEVAHLYAGMDLNVNY
jgi:sulfoxide reductase catalytic subunit YedY